MVRISEIGGKSCVVRFSVSQQFLKRLHKKWNVKEHPNIAVTYPHPENKFIQKEFESRSEFIFHNLKVILNMNKSKLKFHYAMNNPYLK